MVGAAEFFFSLGLFLLPDSLFCVFWAEPGFSEKAAFSNFFGVGLGFCAIFFVKSGSAIARPLTGGMLSMMLCVCVCGSVGVRQGVCPNYCW